MGWMHVDCSLRRVLGLWRLLNRAWEIVWDGAGLLRPKTCWGSCCSTNRQAVESRIILDCVTVLCGRRQYMPQELYVDVLKTLVDRMWSNQIISVEYVAVIWRVKCLLWCSEEHFGEQPRGARILFILQSVCVCENGYWHLLVTLTFSQLPLKTLCSNLDRPSGRLVWGKHSVCPVAVSCG